tara:strand:+ start:447 stop:1952 length:1506 start_codon:yes stop_codon:yes gene_type:complete
MANLDNNILVVIEPTIRPTDVIIETLDEDKGNDKGTKAFGTDQPHIRINNYYFYPHDIVSFRLSVNGFVPRLSVTLNDSSMAFDTGQYPRDGDVITVYINSKNQDTYKSIHMDFDITSVNGTSHGLPNSVRTYSFQGICKIPGLFTEECKSLANGTSLDHIEEISSGLKIGLATNVDATNDAQPRIQPYTTTLDFIKNITNYSYVGEEAFQTFYIDQYYYLNFIEMNKIFNSKNPKGDDFQDSIASFGKSFSVESGTPDLDNIKTKLFLSNNPAIDGTTNKISQWYLKNNSSKISLSNGYKRILQTWDDNEESNPFQWPENRLVEFDVEPFTSTNLRDMEGPLKGNLKEDHYKSHIKHKYVGRYQDVGLEGNVHVNHKYSLLNNFQNIQELEKMKLVVELESFNPSLYRSQKIPVLIYNFEHTKVAASRNQTEAYKEKGVKVDDKPINTEDDGESQITFDDFTSGYYIIGGIEYIYEEGNPSIRQKLTLLRREWPMKAIDI